MEDDKKKIDESWKETVEKEKEALKKEGAFVPPQADFKFFVTTLAIQAAVFLGQMPNPATNQVEVDLNQAKFIIDTLGVLQEKTKGNLSEEEKQLLENMLYELRLNYIEKQKGEVK